MGVFGMGGTSGVAATPPKKISDLVKLGEILPKYSVAFARLL